MAMAQAIEIPKLESGQKVSEWRKTYVAATALLTEKQKVDLLPVYVNRTAGEREIAFICTEKGTIEEALDELENLVDGAPSRVVLTKKFFDIDVEGKQLDWKSLFFNLKLEGKKAHIPNDIIFIRFLGLVPGGDKFYEDNSDVVKDGLSEEDMLKMYRKIQPKLERSVVKQPEGLVNKQSSTNDEFVFNAESAQVEEETPPKWVSQLQED